MRRKFLSLATFALGATLLLQAQTAVKPAPSFALSGRVMSREEGAMEGVLVSAKRVGGTITVTVVTDAQGRFAFPIDRLTPGAYTISTRAVGFDLNRIDPIDIRADLAATVDLTLKKTADLAAQLSNAEWLASFPGTPDQNASIRNCSHCHTFDLVTRSRHDAHEFMKVIDRMAGYPPLAFPLMPQRTPAPRLGPGTANAEARDAARRRQAEYLATLNLSQGPTRQYTLKTLPRPKGAGTRVIYTEYDLPRATRQPHDVIVDREGMAWYASFGEQVLGRLDPATGKVVEWPIPVLKPLAPTGVLGMRFDRDGNPWLAMQFQGGIARFDRKTEKFQTWQLPPELDGPHVQVNQVSPEQSHVDGKVWFQEAGTYTVLRLDLASGKIEVFAPYAIPRPNVYDVIPDANNNAYFLVYGGEEIGRIDAATGAIKTFKTPTLRSGPRRGMMDAEGRLWFGENAGDRIGMFDTRSEWFQEFSPPTPGGFPYDVVADKNGEVWSGGEYNDRIVRLEPRSGKMIEYLLPRKTNVRRVWVDNRTTPVTFWVGNNHGASIVKLEPLEPARN